MDGSISAIAYDPTDATLPTGQRLFIGSPICLNARSSDGSYTRVSSDEGLPVGNITALAPVTRRGQRQLWIGTTQGVVLWQPGQDPPWRYLYGPRWLVGETVHLMAAVGDGVVVATEAGVTWIEQQEWTLARKAETYEAILTARHDRHGMTAECQMKAFGVLDGCTGHDSDNNGLWTSLVVVAEYMRYAVTGDPEARATASRFLGGMVLLNEITGKRGLMARSACSPTERQRL